MSAIPIKDFEQQIVSKIDALRSMISFIKYSKRARVPMEFMELLEDVLVKVKEKFLLEVKDIRSAGFENEEEEVTTFALTFMPFIREIHEKLCVFLDTSEHIYLSNETLFALRNLTSKFSKDFKLTLVPSCEYIYKVYSFQNLYERLAKPFNIEGIESNNYPNWFFFLQYPNIEAQNILLNCVFAHEIAHFKDFQDQISESLIKDIHIEEKAFGELIERQLKEPIEKLEGEKPQQLTFKDVWGKERIERDLYKMVTVITRNWLTEIVADLLALRTLGPAFLYSLIQYSLLLQIMHNYSDSHPASSWRIKYCIDELKELGAFDTIKNKKIKLYLNTWKKHIDKSHRKPESGIYNVSFLTLQNALDKIRRYIRVVSKTFTIDMKIYNKETDKIKKEFFLKCIPPIAVWNAKKEKSIYFNKIYIINAAWEVFLTEKENFCKNFDIKNIDDSVKAIEVLNKLTLKAIEGSDLLELCQA